MNELTSLDLFSGGGLFHLGTEQAGFRTIAFCETDQEGGKYCQLQLKENFPDIPILNDVSKVKGKVLSIEELYPYLCKYDSNLQDKISEWEMLYWLDRDFTFTTKGGTQIPHEGSEIQQSSPLQCIEEIRIFKRRVGSIIKSRDNRGSKSSGNKRNKIQPFKLQCSQWWYDCAVSDSGNTQENIRRAKGQNNQQGDESNFKRICTETIFDTGIQGGTQPNHEGDNGSERNSRQDTSRKKQKKSSTIQDIIGELQTRDDNYGTTQTDRSLYLVHYSKNTPYTVVTDGQGTIIIFRGTLGILNGGSPCQTFSNMGDRASLDDPRGLLIFEYFRVVKETRPRAFIYENVPGLKSAVDNNGKKVVQIVSRICNQLGYTIYAKMLHSDNYGVPQSRKRLFIVGFRNDLNVFGFEFPRPIPLKVRLLDLCEPEVDEKYYLSEKGIKFITNNMRQKKGFTSINPDISLPLTHKGQANWTGSFIEDVNLNPKVKINPEISTTLGCNQYKNSDGTFIAPELTQVGHIGNANSRGNRVYDPNGLATSIMGNAGGGGGKTGLYIVGYTRKGKDISYHLKDKSNTLKTPAGNTQQYLAEGKRIRRLTPRETFRLQGVDDFL